MPTYFCENVDQRPLTDGYISHKDFVEEIKAYQASACHKKALSEKGKDYQVKTIFALSIRHFNPIGHTASFNLAIVHTDKATWEKITSEIRILSHAPNSEAHWLSKLSTYIKSTPPLPYVGHTTYQPYTQQTTFTQHLEYWMKIQQQEPLSHHEIITLKCILSGYLGELLESSCRNTRSKIKVAQYLHFNQDAKHAFSWLLRLSQIYIQPMPSTAEYCLHSNKRADTKKYTNQQISQYTTQPKNNANQQNSITTQNIEKEALSIIQAAQLKSLLKIDWYELKLKEALSQDQSSSIIFAVADEEDVQTLIPELNESLEIIGKSLNSTNYITNQFTQGEVVLNVESKYSDLQDAMSEIYKMHPEAYKHPNTPLPYIKMECSEAGRWSIHKPTRSCALMALSHINLTTWNAISEERHYSQAALIFDRKKHRQLFTKVLETLYFLKDISIQEASLEEDPANKIAMFLNNITATQAVDNMLKKWGIILGMHVLRAQIYSYTRAYSYHQLDLLSQEYSKTTNPALASSTEAKKTSKKSAYPVKTEAEFLSKQVGNQTQRPKQKAIISALLTLKKINTLNTIRKDTVESIIENILFPIEKTIKPLSMRIEECQVTKATPCSLYGNYKTVADYTRAIETLEEAKTCIHSMDTKIVHVLYYQPIRNEKNLNISSKTFEQARLLHVNEKDIVCLWNLINSFKKQNDSVYYSDILHFLQFNESDPNKTSQLLETHLDYMIGITCGKKFIAALSKVESGNISIAIKKANTVASNQSAVRLTKAFAHIQKDNLLTATRDNAAEVEKPPTASCENLTFNRLAIPTLDIPKLPIPLQQQQSIAPQLKSDKKAPWKQKSLLIKDIHITKRQQLPATQTVDPRLYSSKPSMFSKFRMIPAQRTTALPFNTDHIKKELPLITPPDPFNLDIQHEEEVTTTPSHVTGIKRPYDLLNSTDTHIEIKKSRTS